MGLQPITENAQHAENKQLTDTNESCLHTSLQTASESDLTSTQNIPCELDKVIKAWTALPDHVKQTILTLVDVSKKK